MYFGIISKLSYFCCAVHLLSYYIWSFCALAKFTYFVILCILDNRCKRLKFNQYTFNKTTARPFFSVQSGSATKPALKLRTRTLTLKQLSTNYRTMNLFTKMEILMYWHSGPTTLCKSSFQSLVELL